MPRSFVDKAQAAQLSTVPRFFSPPLSFPTRLYQCTDSLWRWHSPSPSSTCWSTADKAIAQQSADNPTTDYNKILSDEVDGVPAQNEIVQSVKGVSNQEVLPSAAAKKEACFLAGDGSDTPSEDCPVASESLLTDSASVSVDPGVALGAGWGGTVGLDAAAVLRNTVLVSISGGAEDLMVHPSLCVADGLGLEGQTVDFTTAAMEECGFGVDHLALVWCKQLVGRYGWRFGSRIKRTITVLIFALVFHILRSMFRLRGLVLACAKYFGVT